MRHTIPLLITMLLTIHLSAMPDGLAIDEQDAIKDATQEFDSVMRRFMRQHGVPGAAVAIAVDGEVVYEQGFGWADSEEEKPVSHQSRFRIASISKPITAVAIMQLVEQGSVSLDDNPFELIGLGNAIKAPGRDPRLAKITVKQVLSHRAGWDQGNSGYDPMFHEAQIIEALGLQSRPSTNDVIRFMIDQPLNFDPGTKMTYSNFGYCLLGRVIEHVSGKGYEEFVSEHVLSPLGINNMKIGRSLREDRFDGEVVYYDRTAANQEQGRSYTSNPELMDAHGGWIASAGDLARFAGAFSDPANCPLLKEETIETMWAPQETNPSSVWYGLGWKVRGLGNERYNAWHGGLLLNCCSTIMVRLSDGTTWAVLFNTDTSATNNKALATIMDTQGLVHQAARSMRTALPQQRSP